MKDGILLKAKNIFMYIALMWTVVMAVTYLAVLFELPVFALISYLPFGEAFCDILVFLLLLGIWVVPFLYIITMALMLFCRVKLKEKSQNKAMALTVIILPLCLTAIMLLTNFMELLA